MSASKLSFIGVAIVAAVLAGCAKTPRLPGYEQTVSGVTIDIGVMPGQNVAPHRMGAAGAGSVGLEMNQNPTLKHLTVALFDAKTGRRITDARVEAGVGTSSSNDAPTQWLQAMPIGGMMSYGGLFPLTGRQLWRIHLRIYLAGSGKPVDAVFGYQSGN